MPRPFAQYYDAIYGDKDYDNDIVAFETIARLALPAEKRVLEIGAGTGNHSTRLARKVGRLVSIEIDADFAEVLKTKLAGGSAQNLSFFNCPVEKLLESGFDAAAAFFHVLNYIGPDHLESFFAGLAQRLKPGAPFVADVWNGSAALLDPPREELRRKNSGTMSIVQRIRPSFNVARRRVTLDYEIDIDTGQHQEKLAERIDLYLWFREELESILQCAGFSNVAFWDYRRFPAAAQPDSWRLWLRALRN